jgi:hypothetical protein
MAVMGANNFAQFILSFFSRELLMIFEHLYYMPIINQYQTIWPRLQMIFRRKVRGNKRMTRDQKAKEELEWRKINEEIEIASEGIEPMLDNFIDYTVSTTGNFLTPIAYSVLLLFYKESQIAYLYNIQQHNMIYYILFASFCVPFQVCTFVFVLSLQLLCVQYIFICCVYILL